MGYFNCKQILQRLAETSERTLFGGLSGPAREWEKVVRVYTKGHVYLGEAALTLASNVDYEIPLLRKQAAAWNAQLSDLEKKEEETAAAARAAATTFKKDCAALDITGTSIVLEVQELPALLPTLLSETVDACQHDALGEAVQFYQDFTAYSLPQAPTPALTQLREVRDGATAAPSEDLTQDAPAASSVSVASEIVWDCEGSATLAESALGEAPDAAETGAALTLDWDIGVVTDDVVGEGVVWDIDVGAADMEGVNWDIDVAAAGVEEPILDSTCVTLEDAGAAEPPLATADTTAGPAALRLVHDLEYRNALQDNLAELQAFLTARSAEAASRTANMLMATAPEALQRIGQDHCKRMLQSVETALQSLNRQRVRQLLLIKQSPQYKTRLVRSLELKASQEGKLLSSLRDVHTRRSEVKNQLVQGTSKLQLLVEQTRQLKKCVEEELASIVRRPVNIIGDINVVLK